MKHIHLCISVAFIGLRFLCRTINLKQLLHKNRPDKIQVHIANHCFYKKYCYYYFYLFWGHAEQCSWLFSPELLLVVFGDHMDARDWILVCHMEGKSLLWPNSYLSLNRVRMNLNGPHLNMKMCTLAFFPLWKSPFSLEHVPLSFLPHLFL